MYMDRYNLQVYLNRRFKDFEHFATAIRGWDVDFRQLDRGEFQTEVIQVDTPAVLITEAIFNRQVDQKGGAPPQAWTFAILGLHSPDVIWRGQTFTNQMMAVYPPGSEIDASSPPGFQVLTLSIPLDVFEGWDALYNMDGSNRIQPMCMLINVGPSRLAAIRRAARRTITAALSGRSLIQELVEDLPNQIVWALSDATSIIPKPSAQKRTRLLRVLTAYIDAHPKASISLADLCAVAKASPRTIQYIFMDRFGVSPKQYIQARKLNGVYRDLCRAEHHGTKISDVANDWGFWHMGQFAADYRRLFSELPSETMQRHGCFKLNKDGFRYPK